MSRQSAENDALANMIAAASQARDECHDDLQRSWHQGRVSALIDAKRQTESWVAAVRRECVIPPEEGNEQVSRYQVGNRVIVKRITPTHRDQATGVVTELPSGDSPYYVVNVDGEDLYLPVDEILSEVAPADPTPAEMLAWLRA